MKFENLRKLVTDSNNKAIIKQMDYILNGVDYDDLKGVKLYATSTRWSQYLNGVISLDKLQDFAYKRMKKQYEKRLDDTLAQIENVENSELPTKIIIRFWWTYTQYYICHAKVTIDGECYEGVASGYGYDKESSAVAKCFNENNGLLKYLYMKKNESPEESNRDLLGYGSGCGDLPYFEGGVGMNCFIRILESFGFNTNYIPLYKGDAYIFTKEACNG